MKQFLITTIFILILPQLVRGQDTLQKADTGSVHQQSIGECVQSIGNDIRCIYQDEINNYWIATNGQGVFKYNGKTIIRYTEADGLCSDFVWNIQKGRDGKLWFKTKDAVCYFDGRKFISAKIKSTLEQITTQFNINNLLLNEYIWNGKELIQISLPKTSSLPSVNPKFDYDIYCTLKDSKGNLWFGTCTAGVCKYDGRTYTWLNYPGLGVAVRSIFEDKNGNIWIGNNGYGLFRYDGKSITNVTEQYKLDNPEFIKTFEIREGTLARVWSIAEDKAGNLWIASIDNGVWKFEGGSFKNYTTNDGLGTEVIWTIYRDRNRKLWFGTDGAGVYRYEAGLFKKVLAPEAR